MTRIKNTPVLGESVIKRIRKAGYDQPRHGSCIICGKSWDDCPHDREQVAILVTALRTGEALGIIPQ